MPCGMCVAAIVRSRIESSDLAGRVGAGDYCGCAATIVTVHEFSSRRSNSLVPFGRVGHRDAIEETWGRGAARRWMKRSPLRARIFARESDNDLLSQPGTTVPHFEGKPDAR